MTLRILSIVLLLALATWGCEKKCFVPAGDYSMTVEPITGDCPEQVLDTFENYSDTVTVDPKTECAPFVTEVDGETEGGCSIDMKIDAASHETGLDEGRAVLDLTCGEKFSCRHEFDVIFAKK